MLAAYVAPEMELDAQESKELAGALEELNRLYPQEWLSEKTAAWINLAQVTGAIYGTRLFAIRLRMQGERYAARVNAPPPLHASPVNPTPETTRPVPPENINGFGNQEVAPKAPPGMQEGEIAGLGKIEFPADHPLMGGARKH